MRQVEALPGLASAAPALIERARTAAVVVLLRSGAIASKFGVTLFIARFLDLEALGLYGFVTGATVVLPVLIGQGVIGSLCRDSVEQSPGDVTRAFAPYWTLLAAAYAVIAAAASPWAYHDGHALLVPLACALVFVEHLNGDILILLNHRRQPRLANALLLARTVAWIAAYTGLAFLLPDLRTLPVLLAFWLAGAGVALACFFWTSRAWPWRAAFAPGPHRRGLLGLMRRSRTLYANEMVNTGSQYLDRYLVGAFLGLELAGIYFLFWSFANALSNLVSTSLLQVQQPVILAARADPRTQGSLLGRLRIEVACICVLLGGATAVLAHLFLVVFHRPAFSGQGVALTVLIVGFVLRIAYEVEGIGFFARHEDRSLLLSGLCVLAMSVSLTMALTPALGLLGPASAVVASYAAGGLWRLARNRSVYAAAPGPAAPRRCADVG